MKRPKPQWWMWPAIMTGGIAAFGTLGTIAVNYATYAALPKRVEAGEAQNEAQDKQIDRLITLQEYYQKQQQQTQGLREYDGTDEQFWCCSLTDRQRCFDERLWKVCP